MSHTVGISQRIKRTMTKRKQDMPEPVDASPEDIAHAILNAPVPEDWDEFEGELEREFEEADE